MSTKKPKLTERDVKGFKYFELLSRLLSRLHDTRCKRDRAHNRRLHMDQYLSLLVLSFFNPLCESLRGIQRAGELKKVQKKLGVSRTSMGSLSEAARIFDAELLESIIGDLVGCLQPIPHDARLSDIKGVLTLVDGTLLRALSTMTWASWKHDQNGIKAHVQFELLKGVPVAAEITAANTSEKDILAKNLQPGRVYVIDRGYVQYSLFQEIIDAKSHFICRIPDNAVFEVVEERELSQEALDAGVVRDAVVRLGCASRRNSLGQPVRIVEVECTPHRKAHKNGRGGPDQGDTILIAIDLLDVPPEVVALVFERRWQIEIFFRFFKHVLGCRHLLSECENGIQLQIYAAIIACLLIALWTGRKPTRATYEMICYWFTGWADDDELMAHIDKLKDQGGLEKVG